jgi:selenide,water dikinase
MASGSNVSISIHYEHVPVLYGAEGFARMGVIPAGTYRNKKYLHDKYVIQSSIKEYQQDVLLDPQTSGGLLLAVNHDQADSLLAALKGIKTQCGIIGEITEKKDSHFIYVD